jgi:hypothetical protein
VPGYAPACATLVRPFRLQVAADVRVCCPTYRGQAIESREAFGVRGACSRFRTRRDSRKREQAPRSTLLCPGRLLGAELAHDVLQQRHCPAPFRDWFEGGVIRRFPSASRIRLTIGETRLGVRALYSVFVRMLFPYYTALQRLSVQHRMALWVRLVRQYSEQGRS